MKTQRQPQNIMNTIYKSFIGPQLEVVYIKKLTSNFLGMVSIVAIACTLLIWSAQSISANLHSAKRDPMKHFFNLSFYDLEDELQTAIDENKTGIFIMFGDETCPWCEKMKLTTLNRVDVQKYYREHFRVLTIDISGGNMIHNFDGSELSEKDFAFKLHRVRATPVFMFFDTRGKKIIRFTGITRNAKEFIWLGEFVVNGEYKKTNFTKYKRSRKEQEKNATKNKLL